MSAVTRGAPEGFVARHRADAVALVALLRRDLLAGQRGAAVLWARMLALVASGGVVLLLLSEESENARRGASEAAPLLFMLLLVAGFVLAPAVAVASLRQEREAGMLDLLLLGGVRPGLLCAGRILSTFLLLQSLLFAALPGLSLFWYFRRPSWPELLIAALTLTFHYLAVASVFVAVSAWSRHGGSAVAVSCSLVAAWAVAFLGGMAEGLPVVPAVLLERLVTGPGHLPSFADVAACAAANLVVALVGWAAATRGLVRVHATRVTRDRLLEKVEKRRLALTGDWPLTWLLQRTSAPARPGVQLALGLVAAGGALALPHDGTLVVGALTVVAGLLVAASMAAASIAPSRERKTWPSLLATSMTGRRLVADVARSAAIGSAPLVGAGCLAIALGARGLGVGTPRVALAAVVGLVATWGLAVTAGIAASLTTRSTAGAIMLTAALLFAEPSLALAGSFAFEGLGRTLGDGTGAVSWLALVAASSFGGAWLILRAGWRRPATAALALLPAVATALLPALIEPSRSMMAGPFVGAAAFGASLLAHGFSKERGGAVLLGALVVAGCFLAPLAGAACPEDDRLAGMFGTMSWPVLLLDVVVDGSVPDASTLDLGSLHHVLLALLIALLFLPRLERWLGRAG